MEPIDKYQQAVNEIKAAIREVERLILVISSGSQALLHWKRVIVSNLSTVQGGFPFPPSSRTPTINAKEWPTGEQIAEVLLRYHRAELALQNAYKAIPEGRRAVVQDPKTFLGA